MIVDKDPEAQTRIELLKLADIAARRLATKFNSWLCWEDMPPNGFAREPDHRPAIRENLAFLQALVDHLDPPEEIRRLKKD